MSTPLTDEATSTAAPPARRRGLLGNGFVQLVLVMVCSLLVCGPFLVDRIRDNPGISPQDELSYIDTLVRIQDGQWLMRQGDTVDPETLQELGCRGITGSALPPNEEVCEGGPSDVVFYNTADIDPPVYHWTTAVLSRVPYELGLTGNVVTAARMLGILWCTLTMTTIFFLARRLGARVLPAAAAAAAPLWLSVTSAQFQYVTPHSTGVLVGAVVALVVASRLADRVPWWLVSLAGLLAATTKLTNLVVVMASAAAFLAAFAWPPGDGGVRPRRRLWDAVNIVGAAMLASLAWVVIRRLQRSSTVEPYEWAVVDSLTPGMVLENVGAFVFPLASGLTRGFAVLLSVAVFGTAAYLLASARTPAVHRSLAAGVLAAGTLAPVALVIMNFVVTSYYVATQGRYGLSLVPVAVALAASQVRHRWLQVTLAVVTVICLALAWSEPTTLVGS
jgi:hypothetical protein